MAQYQSMVRLSVPRLAVNTYRRKGEVQDQKNLPLSQATGKSPIKIQEGAGKHVKKPEELQLELF